MGVNLETAKKADKIAERIAQERGEGLPAELYLTEAYDELFKLNKKSSTQ